MSKSISQDFEGSHGFDCSAFLGHKLQWPSNECPNKLDGLSALAPSAIEYHYPTEFKMSAEMSRDWRCEALTQEEKTTEDFIEEQYYAREYKTLVDWMDEEVDIVPPPCQFADKRNEIQKLCLLADEALDREFLPNDLTCYPNYDPFTSSEELTNEVAMIVTPREEIATSSREMSPGGFQNFVEAQLVGFGETPKKPKGSEVRKRRLCRHFVKGFCLRGSSCAFLHDPSIFCCDEQKVFLGGLPLHLTPEMLKTKLEEQGLRVLNKPRIMRGFTPQVCLGSVKEAERLVAQQHVYICDQRVDVRPYQEEEKLRKTFPSVVKRSVFLGGLPEDTTGEMIVKDMQRLDIKVEVVPVVKSGYAPRVVLASLKDAKMLVALKRVVVNGTVVDVRPYVNFRKRY